MIVFLSTWNHRYTHRCIQKETKYFRWMSYIEAFARRSLPRATYIFSDLDRLGWCELELAAALFREMRKAGFRVLNDPARFPNRLALLQRLHRAGVNSFRAWSAEDWTEVDRFPSFLRTKSAHRGNLSELFPDRDALGKGVDELVSRGFPLNDLMISEYCAEPFENDIFRKLSIYRIGEIYVPEISVHERSWTTKYGTNGVASDAAYEQDLARIRENAWVHEARAAFEVADIDYGRADFGIVQGRAEFYEINTNPMMFSPEKHRHPDRVEAMRLSHERYLHALEAVNMPEGGAPVRAQLPPYLLAGRRSLRLVPGYQWRP